MSTFNSLSKDRQSLASVFYSLDDSDLSSIRSSPGQVNPVKDSNKFTVAPKSPKQERQSIKSIKQKRKFDSSRKDTHDSLFGFALKENGAGSSRGRSEPFKSGSMLPPSCNSIKDIIQEMPENHENSKPANQVGN
ncbi:hypothetical protein HDE_12578 [Halotydeus destructor]|nr:hypothetical protein HDE_12578 [Halotydeus destructor]